MSRQVTAVLPSRLPLRGIERLSLIDSFRRVQKKHGVAH